MTAVIPNGTRRAFTQFTVPMMKKPRAMRRPGTVVKTHKGKRGMWEIYRMKDGTYGNRLISRNGLIICGNKGFNKLANAVKNMRAVQSSC